MKSLVIGIGNPGRGDDALGPALVERLAGVEPGSLPENSVVRIPGGPSVVWKYQLNIEDALLIRDFDNVVFADASHEDDEPVTWVDIAPAAAIAFTTHALPPAAVLGLAEELYGRIPRAHLLAMRGERWEAAAELSESAAANLARALDLLARAIIPTP